jgi:2-aminoethylphosphonate-pyruvate transaminase
MTMTEIDTPATVGDRRLLFTPGPLTTTDTVRQAMLRDWGSRDREFIDLVRDLRTRLVRLAAGNEPEFQAIPMQGSGTFGIESVIGSAAPKDGSLMVFVNGAYGRRMVRIAETLGIACVSVELAENEPVTAAVARGALHANPDVSHVAVVHCETTTGILNPVSEVAEVVSSAGRRVIVDAMSSFGAIELDAPACGVDFIVSSSNKCIQGVPGFSFVIARKEALEECRGRARSVSLDLYDQWLGLERDGQFRFTPPTHVLAAFRRALNELDAEGGVAARGRRYSMNHCALMEGMRRLGLRPYLAAEHQSPVITSFRYPDDDRFDFQAFYGLLSQRGFVIYPGKLSSEDCFRIGTIGDLHPPDIRRLISAMGEVLREMGVRLAGAESL